MDPETSILPYTPPNRFQQASMMLARVHRYLLVLRKHWWIIPLSMCLSLVPSMFWSSHQPAQYSSTSRLWISRSSSVPESLTAREVDYELAGTRMATEAELMRSGTIRQRTLDKLQQKFPTQAVVNTNLGEPLQFMLNVMESRKAAIFDLEAIGNDPVMTREFLTALMNEYLVFKKEAYTQSSDTTLNSITEQVKQLDVELKSMHSKIQAFLSSNNLVFLQEQGSSAGNYLATINRQLAALRTEFNLLDLLNLDQLMEVKTAPAGEMPNSQNLASSLTGFQAEYFKVNQQLQLLTAKREEMSQYLRPSHPKILQLNQDLVNQQRLIEMFRQQSLVQLANRKQSLGLQIKNLESACTEWEGKALEASRKMAEYERMTQDLKRTQGLYERLLSALQTVDLSKNLAQENILILEPASPSMILRSNARRMLGMALAAGLALGLGVLFIIELFDDRFASIAELRNHLFEVVVGQVPELPPSRSTDRLTLIQANDDRHVFVESFRNIRSSLLFAFEGQKRPKTILITSSVPDEGKSTIAANLAVTLALGGSRVLLIDADLRRSALHQLFNLEQKPGLAEIMKQEISCAQTIKSTSVANLSLIPAGETQNSPGELFLSPVMGIFLREIYPQYDYILFDSAPVLATDDTASLAPNLEGVLFVVRGVFTSSRLAREALDLLHQRKINILGLIFNRAVSTAMDYYYFYRYRGYQYRPKKDIEPRETKSAD
jgi:polysaccharide biosynthesis transport protein